MNTWVEKNDFEEQIESLIHELVTALVSPKDPRILLKTVSAKPNVAEPEVCTRTRQVLFQNPQFEVVLMTWGRGSASPIHGHGGSQCYMHVLSGELIETRYRPYDATPVHQARLTNQTATHINDEACFHKLESATGAVSLHLYARPLHSMQVYDEALGTWVNRVANESL